MGYLFEPSQIYLRSPPYSEPSYLLCLKVYGNTQIKKPVLGGGEKKGWILGIEVEFLNLLTKVRQREIITKHERKHFIKL